MQKNALRRPLRLRVHGLSALRTEGLWAPTAVKDLFPD
ncbi:hypothetical protein J2Z66_002857 [Paenibacillus eucommiae]|uniref:Uncharacterized protein n=1 Tax=Paenibacillus eucommiae TaxID=1355755 RepID=A0ABS4IUK0_9BACL|nr:hypothetical protein [Paenibacillus eucommiae]